MTVNVTTDTDGNPKATLVNAGTGYNQGDTVTFNDPGGVGAALSVQVASALASAATAPVVSTCAVAAGSNPALSATHSTANSGDLSLNAPQIFIGAGTVLLANADSGFTGGAIRLTANAQLNFTLDVTSALSTLIPWKVHETTADIEIAGATLRGNTVQIIANSNPTSFAGYDVFGQGWESLVAGKNVANLSNDSGTTLTFQNQNGASGATITRDVGSWLTDGFEIGQEIQAIGSRYNDLTTFTVADVTPLVITLSNRDVLTNEVDTGTATIKQLLSSVLPQDTPVEGKDAQGNVKAPVGNVFNVGNLVKGFGQLGAMSELISGLLQSAFFGVTSKATATIQTVGTTTIAADDKVDIETASTPSAEANSPGILPTFNLGVTYANSEGTATTTINSGTSITAGGDFILNALVTNSMKSKVNVSAGLIMPTVTLAANAYTKENATGVKIPGPAISVAYGKARSTSSVLLAQGASVTVGGNVDINANNANEFEVSATTRDCRPGAFQSEGQRKEWAFG